MAKIQKQRLEEFSAELYSKVYPDGSEKHYWTYSRNLIIENELRFNHLEKGVILDIGAGRGITVDYLTKKGFDCYGCDLGNPKVYPDVKKRMFVSTDAFDLPKNLRLKIETILLLDVLEHMAKPETFLTNCRRNFPNLKTIIAAVPARPEIWSNYDEYYGHYKRYDLNGLQKVFTGSGFLIESIGYFFHSLYLFARLLITLTKKRALSLHPVSAPQLHRIIGQLLFREKNFLPSSWYGTSILIVATVKQ